MYEYLVKAYVPPKPDMVPVDPEDPESPLYQPFWDEPYTQRTVYAYAYVGMLGEDRVIAILHYENPTRAEDTLIGAWNFEGVAVEPIDMELYKSIRPLGNAPAQTIYDEDDNPIGELPAGAATKGLLEYTHWAGWKPRQLGDPAATYSMAKLYPPEDVPFKVTIRRKYFDTPTWPGHGWRVEFDADFEESGRSPTDYFINVYDAPECTVDDSWYQVGAFTLQDSEWQFDDSDPDNPVPLQVYAAEYNPAHLGHPDREVIYHGMCRGSIHIQEGYGALELYEEEDQYLFWENTQGGVPPVGAEWVDTGATVIAQYGAIYHISDVNAVNGLSPDQAIKLGDAETTFTGIRAGFPDQIQIDPFVSVQVGAVLWEWA